MQLTASGAECRRTVSYSYQDIPNEYSARNTYGLAQGFSCKIPAKYGMPNRICPESRLLVTQAMRSICAGAGRYCDAGTAGFLIRDLCRSF
jgi:hypothetical protein